MLQKQKQKSTCKLAYQERGRTGDHSNNNFVGTNLELQRFCILDCINLICTSKDKSLVCSFLILKGVAYVSPSKVREVVVVVKHGLLEVILSNGGFCSVIGQFIKLCNIVLRYITQPFFT